MKHGVAGCGEAEASSDAVERRRCFDRNIHIECKSNFGETSASQRAVDCRGLDGSCVGRLSFGLTFLAEERRSLGLYDTNDRLLLTRWAGFVFSIVDPMLVLIAAAFI